MNTQILLNQYFETAFSAPDGIKRLRELILSLAMQGKLVPQDPNDQPARELLQEIEAEKQRLIKAGKIKKQKPLPPIQPEEFPYELPESWEWVRLGDIGESQTGTTPPRNDLKNFGDFIPFINPGDIKENSINYFANGLSEIGLRKGRLIKKNSILMVCIGGSIGKHAINNMDVTCNQQINTITPFIDGFSRFLFYAMKSYFFQHLVISQAGGSATPIINKQKWSLIPIPLPPLAEQKRIVEKIDRLMAQCNELEKRQQEREQKRILVHTSAVQKLLNAPEEKTFGDAWQFIKQNFGELYAVKENVSELRKAILQLAVMGKLVPQDPNDPPASELLKEITAEKQRLIKEGKIKSQKPLPEITADEIPYTLPKNWEWVRLAEITSVLGDGIHGTPQYDHLGNYLFINGNNLINGSIEIKENTKKVNHQEYLKYQKPLNKNTVFVSINGTIGNVAFYDFEKIILGKSVCYFNLLSNVEKQYIKKIIESKYFLDYAFNSATGTTIKNVSLKAMRFFLIPLPPLPEQHRIVAKVDALMALCDQLENQIDQQTAKQTQLLEAVMAGI